MIVGALFDLLLGVGIFLGLAALALFILTFFPRPDKEEPLSEAEALEHTRPSTSAVDIRHREV
jgi:hypothetical protein